MLSKESGYDYFSNHFSNIWTNLVCLWNPFLCFIKVVLCHALIEIPPKNYWWFLYCEKLLKPDSSFQMHSDTLFDRFHPHQISWTTKWKSDSGIISFMSKKFWVLRAQIRFRLGLGWINNRKPNIFSSSICLFLRLTVVIITLFFGAYLIMSINAWRFTISSGLSQNVVWAILQLQLAWEHSPLLMNDTTFWKITSGLGGYINPWLIGRKC